MPRARAFSSPEPRNRHSTPMTAVNRALAIREASSLKPHISGLEKIVATRTLGEFEKMINNPWFFRIHKSILLNLNYLRGYSSHDGYFAELIDGTRLSVSRRKSNEFREAVKQLSKSSS